MSMTITTNRHWREFLDRSDVPEKVLANQFDWTKEAYEEHGDYSDGFLCYHGHWYHLADFLLINPELEGQWDGAASDSMTTGVLIKLSQDGERYIIASYRS